MRSAFGVDHGMTDEEIEKAFGLGGVGMKIASGAKKVVSGFKAFKANPVEAGKTAKAGIQGFGAKFKQTGGARRAAGGPKIFGAQTGGARKAVAAPKVASETPMFDQLAAKHGFGTSSPGRRKAY